MIIPAQEIRRRAKAGLIEPFVERHSHSGTSFGLSPAGYDIRIRQTITIKPGEFKLASVVEYVTMPNDLIGFVYDKSTWARCGLSLFNTVIEPGWHGFLTLELFNASDRELLIMEMSGIAQIVFQKLDEPTEEPYDGKYQAQPPGPVAARFYQR